MRFPCYLKILSIFIETLAHRSSAVLYDKSGNPDHISPGSVSVWFYGSGLLKGCDRA